MTVGIEVTVEVEVADCGGGAVLVVGGEIVRSGDVSR